MIKKLNVLLFVLGLVIMGVLNLFLHSRQEVSAAENRALAKFPEFSMKTLKSGEFFTGIETFYADRFMFRDQWIGVSNKLNALKGNAGEDEAEIITLDVGDQFAADPDKAPKTEKTNEEAPTVQEPAAQAAAETEEVKAVAGVVSSVADLNDRVKLYAGKDIEAYLAAHPEEAKMIADASQPVQTEPNTEIAIEDIQGNEVGEMRSNFLVLKDAAYEVFGYHKGSCQFYAEAINQFAAQMPETTRIFSLIAPSHIEFIQNKKYREMSGSQEEAIAIINSFLSPRVLPADARSSLLPHYQEYLYFRSDHHWTARGAYYAYEAFVKTAGFSPVTLDKYEKKEFPGFLGTLYDKTRSAKIAANPDTVEVFMPIVQSDFKIHTRGGGVLNWQVINEGYGKPSFKNKYLVFLSGDEPLSVITTNVDTDRKILVFKDSYGNAFIPFLMNHYKEIHVIDPRHFQANATAYAKENGFDDVLFLNYAVVIAGNQNFAKNIIRVSQ
ncbi:hypothetical protein EII17_08845 [Clostridiales bacterium COT073_COT-073]|nr:hypothetical protein EII17_08845 [Clostridiales bacterium COT073_COT-073]